VHRNTWEPTLLAHEWPHAHGVSFRKLWRCPYEDVTKKVILNMGIPISRYIYPNGFLGSSRCVARTGHSPHHVCLSQSITKQVFFFLTPNGGSGFGGGLLKTQVISKTLSLDSCKSRGKRSRRAVRHGGTLRSRAPWLCSRSIMSHHMLIALDLTMIMRK